jgi:hypothetical protein
MAPPLSVIGLFHLTRGSTGHLFNSKIAEANMDMKHTREHARLGRDCLVIRRLPLAPYNKSLLIGNRI